MAFRLISSLGTWDLAEGDTLVGRSRACAICFLDARLSRRHATFTVNGLSLMVGDPGSTNGVLVNGHRILTQTTLKKGDDIIVGPCQFRVDTDTSPAPTTTTSRRVGTTAQPSTAIINTDAIEKRDNDGSLHRRINPVIAAALTPSQAEAARHAQAQPASEPFIPSVYQEPKTSAVMLRPTEHHETSTLKPSDNVHIETDGLLEAHERASTLADDIAPPLPQVRDTSPEPALITPRRRILAGIADITQALLVSTLVTIPVLAGGSAIALHQAGAVIEDGRPLMVFGRPASPVWDLFLNQCTPYGWIGCWAIIPGLQQYHDSNPLLILSLSIILGICTFITLHLAITVVPTCLIGGPFWHHRLGLRIVEVRTGRPPSWSRTSLRWLAVLITWPMAWLPCLRGQRGWHDRWSGCDIRPRIGPR